jgi:hypothetical protein
LPEGCNWYAAGDPDNGYPNWRERTVALFSNAVRVDPLGYRDNYSLDYSPSTATILTTYPAQDPLTWSKPLNVAARDHALDMATRNYFSHSTLEDGGPGDGPLARMQAAGYNEGGTWAENIAAGRSAPRDTVNQWLCDRTGNPNDGGTYCCADGDSCDGHRRGIMNGNLIELGVGYAYNSGATYNHYWVQDFGAGTPDSNAPLITGSHSLTVDSGKISFLAVVDDPGAGAPTLVVVVNGASSTLALDLGTASRGLYRYDEAEAGGCRSYYFVMTDGDGQVWRTPGVGEYRTTSESGCSEEYAGP